MEEQDLKIRVKINGNEKEDRKFRIITEVALGKKVFH